MNAVDEQTIYAALDLMNTHGLCALVSVLVVRKEEDGRFRIMERRFLAEGVHSDRTPHAVHPALGETRYTSQEEAEQAIQKFWKLKAFW